MTIPIETQAACFPAMRMPAFHSGGRGRGNVRPYARKNGRSRLPLQTGTPGQLGEKPSQSMRPMAISCGTLP